MTRSERRFAVWLHEYRVGTLYVHDDHTRFVLEPEYVCDPDRPVLGLRFEEDLEAQHRSNLRLPPWFSNLLPEGVLRKWIAESRGVSEAREMELLAEVGHDLPGAVRVTSVTEDQVEAPPPAPREVVSARAGGDVHEPVWRFSLAGVGMKLSMLEREDRFTAPGTGEGGDWIIKLPDPKYPQVPRNEFAMMELARQAGIDVPETRLVSREQLDDAPDHLWPSNEQMAYAVKRFDRGGGGRRIHMEDMAQVRGFYPEDKYSGTFETVAALVYRGRDVGSLIELVKRLAFNVLISNEDAHLKNWTLLYDDPRVPRLSPAYDLVSTVVYKPPTEPENLGLRFGGSRRLETVSLGTFMGLQQKLRLDDPPLADVVRELAARVQTAWPRAAEILKDAPDLSRKIKANLDRRMSTLLRG